MDTIGYALDPATAIANLTKNQMLRSLGKQASGLLKMRNKYGQRDVDNPLVEFKGRVKSVAQEIRSAPEDVFEPVKVFKLTDAGSNWTPVGNKISLNTQELNPRSLRHELTHAWDDTTPFVHEPQNIASYSRDYEVADKYAPKTLSEQRQLYNKFPHVRYARDLKGGHGFSPYELAAIDQEYIPLGAHSDIYDYMVSLRKSADNALVESIDRRRAARFVNRVFEHKDKKALENW
jgi:hypothetical protein